MRVSEVLSGQQSGSKRPNRLRPTMGIASAHAPKGRMSRAIPCPSSSTSRPSNWPFTPEVAGSSPVAPVQIPANRHLFSTLDRRLLAHPAEIPHANRPGIPARSRL